MGNKSSHSSDDNEYEPSEEETLYTEQPTYHEDGSITCACGLTLRDEYYYSSHIESMNRKCIITANGIKDPTGWPKRQVDLIPYVSDAQKGVYSLGKSHGLFLHIVLNEEFDGVIIRDALHNVPQVTAEINTTLEAEMVSAVGVHPNLWRKWDPNPPKNMMTFEQKTVGNDPDGEVIFPESSGDLFLFCKSNRIDACYSLSKYLLGAMNEFVKDYGQTLGFTYKPTTGYSPNLGRDLTGFIDGTRNPDHLLRALVDEAIVFPSDEEGEHVGGSYCYYGRFVHDLVRFHQHSDEEKSEIIGRDYNHEKIHKGYDRRPENKRLDEDVYRSKHVRTEEAAPNRYHTGRAHGSMYRQSMPFIEGDEQGLQFIAFARYPIEFDQALKRMAGHFQPDGSTDALLDITQSQYNNYFYIPSLEELKKLEQLRRC
eukprot:TRINITY_DN804_c0_g1_i1.p1 TRINITY_DN804_c0_g1~~TRINITY_DN804_c0_g1_i1.p1  ORF type:complete len:448 (-),score=100.27 TRINITY_DN804_c0_g1_i1:420-1697(-)